MHNTWWIVPVGNIGQIKAKATAKKRSRTITIDGIPSKFHAIAYKYIEETLTEKENMRKNGYRVYYDSGNKVYNLKQLAVLRQNNKKP